eukprot:CAMPEP_0197575204 /NCGR_PEP_ID=MMETSP1326-20131121/674_1 /TAXON_ID=1155430 /ORGANISM="Genus nov. species nov., Strain RCC2288" /LENGTH=74 /DNA_ID=CAMNT_0043137929 /DNA_START=293 /DNA_END=514 /DNA_ORIENTATION=+
MALGCEDPPALEPAAFEHLAPANRQQACKKAVAALADQVGWLVRALRVQVHRLGWRRPRPSHAAPLAVVVAILH